MELIHLNEKYHIDINYYISGQSSHFIFPGNTRKPKVFVVFSGGIKVEQARNGLTLPIKTGSSSTDSFIVKS